MERRTQIVRAHGLRWLAVEEFAATIPRLDIERSRHPEALSRSELVKDNRVRTVVRLSDPDRPEGPGLYLKRYKFRTRRERLKHLLVPTKPHAEWRACRALQAAAIPTCDVLAIAVQRRRGLPGEGFLISREVPGTVSLGQFVEGPLGPEPLGSELEAEGLEAEGQLPRVERQSPSYRRELIEELARLAAQLVDGRFYHPDCHAGNLLIHPAAPRGQRLFVVDLHRIRLRRPGRRGLLRMLAMLVLSTGKAGMSHQDELEFLRAFLGCWQGGRLAERSLALWAERVKMARHRLHRRHMRSRTRRCVVESTLFTCEKAGGFLIHRRRDFPVQSALRVVELHAAAVAGQASGVEVFRKARRTEVTVCPCDTVPPLDGNRLAPSDAAGPGRVCVKCFRRQSAAERLKDVLRPCSRARAAWIASRGFAVRGIPAARALALLERRSKLSGKPDYLVTEALDNDGTLLDLAARGLPPADQRRSLGQAIARLLALMAEEEVYHPDTKPSNLLVKQTDGEFRLWLVDLDRARFSTPWGRRQWTKSLTRLNAGLPAQVTLLDRMRCLRECGRGRWDAKERLAVARTVYGLSLKRRPAWAR